MRTLLHFGLFALALMAVSQASADHDDDDNRRRERNTTIVISPEGGHRKARPVRAPDGRVPPSYDRRYEQHRRDWRHYEPPGLAEARREVHEQRKDHEQIVRIAERWGRATAHRNPHAQYNVDRRLFAWIDREIEESNRKHGHGRYVQRLHALRRELRHSNGWYGYGRGRHRFDSRKGMILDELVELSERQLQRAENRARRHMGFAFAYR